MDDTPPYKHDLGPEQLVEEKVIAAFARLSPFRRPREPAALAYWLGQIVGWPGHDFYSSERRLIDQEVYAATLIRDIATRADALMRVTGPDDRASHLLVLLGARMGDSEAAAGEAYLARLAEALGWLADAPRIDLAERSQPPGRPERDLFAKVPVRVVCAYLIYIEGYAPPARRSTGSAAKMSSLTAAKARDAAPSKPSRPFSRQQACHLSATVLGALSIEPSGDMESLVQYVLKESWVTAGAQFSFWKLLPDVAAPGYQD